MKIKDIKRDIKTKNKEKIISGNYDGIIIKEIEGKGKGLVAGNNFVRKEVVVNYGGELKEGKEAK